MSYIVLYLHITTWLLSWNVTSQRTLTRATVFCPPPQKKQKQQLKGTATTKRVKYYLRKLKGLCHPTRMREPMKTNLKKMAQLFQVVSEILEGCFYLSKSQPLFDS